MAEAVYPRDRGVVTMVMVVMMLFLHYLGSFWGGGTDMLTRGYIGSC